MKQNILGTKAKFGIILLLFSLILLPISPSVSLAAEKGTHATASTDGPVTAQAGAASGTATSGAAAGGAAGAGATTGLSTMTLIGIAAGAAVIGVAVAAGSGGGGGGTTSNH